MKYLPLLLLVLAGCKVIDETPMPSAPPKVVAKTLGGGQGATPDLQGKDKPTPIQDAPDTPPIEPGVNRRRLYQLKELERVTITIGANKLSVWLMNNDSKRAEGMMFLENHEIKAKEGMLFVFPAAEQQGFWMKNTLIPLDIAYIGADKKILNIGHMKPLDENSVDSKGKAQYVLEMKKGAFASLGIKAGMKVDIPKTVKAE